MKKQNVLGKLVIPKIIKAIQYIWSELEEQEREESFRLKRFKQNKYKKNEIEQRERKRRLGLPVKEDKVEEEPRARIKTEPAKAIKMEPERKMLKAKAAPIAPMGLEEPIKPVEEEAVEEPREICNCSDDICELDGGTGKFTCPICKLATEAENTRHEIKVNMVPCQTCLPEITENSQRLEHLMAHINQIIRATKQSDINKIKHQNLTEMFSYTTITEKNEFVPYCLRCNCTHMKLVGVMPKDVCTCPGPQAPCPWDEPKKPSKGPCPCDEPSPEEAEICSCDEILGGPPCGDVALSVQSEKRPCGGPPPADAEICSCHSPGSTKPAPCQVPKRQETDPCPCDATPPAEPDICSCDELKPVEPDICSCESLKPEEPDPCSCEPPKPVEPDPCSCKPPKPVEPDPCTCEPPKPVEPEPCTCEPPKPVEPDPCTCDPPKPVEPDPCTCKPPKPVEPDPCTCEPPKPVEPDPCTCKPQHPKTKSVGTYARGMRSTASDCTCPPHSEGRKISKAPKIYSKPCCYPICQGDVSEKIAKASAPYLKCVSSRQYPCNTPDCSDKPFSKDTTTYYTPCSDLKSPFNPGPRENKQAQYSKSQRSGENGQPCPICSNTMVLNTAIASPPLSKKSSTCSCDTCEPDQMLQAKTSSSYYAAVSQWIYSTLCKHVDGTPHEAYTREGKPGPCGLSATKESCAACSANQTSAVSVKATITASHQGPCDLPATKAPCTICSAPHTTNVSMKATPTASYPEPYTREGRPGPCGTRTPKDTTKLNKTQEKPKSCCSGSSTARSAPARGNNYRCGTHAVNDSCKCAYPVCLTELSTRITKASAPYLNSLTSSRRESNTDCCNTHPHCYMVSTHYSRHRNRESISSSLKDVATYVTTVSQKRTPFCAYTREGKPGSCCITEDNSNVSSQIPGTPYTRQGQPGPCGPVSSIDEPTTRANMPYTREGKPGPCGVFGTIETVQTQVIPYTRQGLAGPCGIGGVDSKQSQLTAYTRQGKPGPCGMYGTTDTAKDTQLIPFTREGKPGPCGLHGSDDTAKDTQLIPFTREGKPGPCGIHGSDDTAKDTHLIPFTREGKPGPCGIHGSDDTTKDTHLIPFTREGKPGPCGLHGSDDTAKNTQLIPYTRQGKQGPCGLDGSDDTAKDTQLVPYTRQGKQGPCGISGTTDTVSPIKTRLTPYTREGRAGPCSACGTNDTINPTESEPYTREGKPGPFGIQETTSETKKSNPFSKNPTVYYVTEIPRRYPTNSDNETSNSLHLLRPTRSNISVFYTTTPQKYVPLTSYARKERSFEAPDECDPSSTSISKNSDAYVCAAHQHRTKNISEANPSFWTICDEESSDLLQRYKLLSVSSSLDSCRPSSSKLYKPYICTPYYIPTEQSNEGTEYMLEKKLGDKLSTASITHSTVAINYVICQSDIKAAIDRASASYLNPSLQTWPLLPKIQAQIKKASQVYLRNEYDDFDPHDMGAAIAKASAAYFQKAPSVQTRSVDSMPNEVFRLPSDRNRSYKPTIPTSGVRASYIPKWVTPSVLTVPSGISAISAPLSCAASSQVYKDICAPYFNTVRSNQTSTIPSTPQQCPMSESCPTASTISSCHKSKKPACLPVAASKCSNCGKAKNLSICSSCGKAKTFSTSIYSHSSAPIADKTLEETKITNTSNIHGDVGYMQTEFKEITKISRYKNPDGTIIDEKQIITIKTEKKTHQKLTDGKAFDVGTCISCSQEYDINSQHKITKKRSYECRPINRDTKSDIVKDDNDLMASPKAKRCLSAEVCGAQNNMDILFGTWEAAPEFEITVSKMPLSMLVPCLSSNMTCNNKVEYTVIGGKSKCPSKGTSMTMFNPTVKGNFGNYNSNCNYAYTLITPASHVQRETTICANRVEVSGPRFNYTNSNECTNDNRPYDSESGPRCSCAKTSISATIDHVCNNRLEDTDSGPKCSCAEKSRKIDTNSDQCSCPETSPGFTTGPVCANRLEDTDSGPKCRCVDRSSSVVTDPSCSCPEASPCMTAGPITANKLGDTDNYSDAYPRETADPITVNKSKDNDSCTCPEGSSCETTDPITVNKSKDNDSCTCPDASPHETNDPITANESKDNDSCSCPNVSPRETTDPITVNKSKDNDSCSCPDASPRETTDPITPNKSKDNDSCTCPDASPRETTDPITVNKSNDDDSCTCPDASPRETTDPITVNKSKDNDSCSCPDASPRETTDPITVNKSKDDDSCTCPDASSRKTTDPIITNKSIENDICGCHDASPRVTTDPITSNKSKDNDSCSCPDASPRETTDPITVNKSKDNDSCSCPDASPRETTDPITPNKSKDNDSCTCPDASPRETTDPITVNKSKDNDSCSCPDASPRETTDPITPNKSKDNDSCTCPDASPRETTDPITVNKSKDNDSCTCPDASPRETTDPITANKSKDDDSCTCPDASSRKTTDPIITNKSIENDICGCHDASPRVTTDPITSNKSKDNDSCSCPDASPREATDPITSNKSKDNDSCSCPDASPRKTTDPITVNKSKDNDSCSCHDASPRVTTDPITANKSKDNDSCSCPDASSRETSDPMTVNESKDNDSCSCPDASPREATDPITPNKSKDNDSCSCPDASSRKTTDPITANKSKDNDSCSCPDASPREATDPITPNKSKDNDSCSCPDASSRKTTDPITTNESKDNDSCSCPDASSRKTTDPITSNKSKDNDSCSCPDASPRETTDPITSNKSKDNDSCSCPDASPRETTDPITTNKSKDNDSCSCHDASPRVTTDPIISNKSKDNDSCSCPDASPRETTDPITSNKSKDNDSCSCHDASPRVTTDPITSNKLKDNDSCSCPDASSRKTTDPMTANKSKDNDSCSCPDASPRETTDAITTNESKDNDSCSCPDASSRKTTDPMTANKSKDDDTCSCPDASPRVKTDPMTANKSEDSDSCSYSKASSHITTDPISSKKFENTDACSCTEASPRVTTNPTCTNRCEDNDSGLMYSCADRSSSIFSGIVHSCPEESIRDMSKSPICTNRLEDAGSDLKCSCANNSSSIVTDPSCSCPEASTRIYNEPDNGNRTKDTDTGPKHSCGAPTPSTNTSNNKESCCPIGPPPKYNDPQHDKIKDTRPKASSNVEPGLASAERTIDADSNPKCQCVEADSTGCLAGRKDKDQCEKCSCPEESLCLTHPVCSNDTNYGRKGDTLCADDESLYDSKLINANNGAKCDCTSEHVLEKLIPLILTDQSWLKCKPRQDIQKFCSSKHSTDCKRSVSVKEMKEHCDLISCLKPGSVTHTDCSYNNSIFINSTEPSFFDYKLKSTDDKSTDNSCGTEVKKTACDHNSIRFSNVCSSTSELTPCNVNSTSITIWSDISKTPKSKEGKGQCIVKLTRKPAKTRCCERRDEEGIFFRGSFLESLKKILQLAKPPKNRCDGKKICKACYSPVSTSFQLKFYPPPCSTCNANKEKPEEGEKVDCYTNVGSITPSSKSIGVDHRASSHSEAYCLSTEYSNCINKKPENKRSCESCPKYKNNDTGCLVRNFSTPNYIKTTCCRESERFDDNDIRPIKKGKIVHVCNNLRSNDHICHSESCISAADSDHTVKKTYSYSDDYFNF